MRVLKKIYVALITACVLTLGCTFVSFAADGSLQFTDPSTTVGAEVTVDAKIDASGDAIGDGNANLTYDTAMLEFVSGTNATGGDGKISLSTTGDGSQSELRYSMIFKALAEGTTTIEVADATSYLYSDETLDLTLGNSTITIGPGTGEETTTAAVSGTTASVTVDGATYTINDEFSDAILPNGFTSSTFDYEGATHKCMVDSSDHYLVYLNDANGGSDYFYYNTEDSSFQKTELAYATTTLTLCLLDHADSEGLPSKFQSTTMTVNSKDFTAWQNTSDTDYYLVYALGSDGSMGYYQYDSVQQTYQRYTVEKETATTEKGSSLADKVGNLFSGKGMLPLLIAAGVFLLLFLLVIVLGTKLVHRNQELDDLYDEYDIPEDDEEPAPKKNKKQKQIVDEPEEYEEDEEYYDDDEYEDDEEEYYDDDEYADDDDEYYDDDEYTEDEEYYDDDEDEIDGEYEEDDEYYDEEEEYDDDDDDEFSVDFIDLD